LILLAEPLGATAQLLTSARDAPNISSSRFIVTSARSMSAAMTAIATEINALQIASRVTVRLRMNGEQCRKLAARIPNVIWLLRSCVSTSLKRRWMIGTSVGSRDSEERRRAL
jgi:hypothetical protein